MKKSKNKKSWLSITLVFVYVAILLGAILWGVINFEKLKSGLSGTQLYDKSDIEKAYQDGYNKCLADKETLEATIASLREELNVQADKLTKAQNENKEYKEELEKYKDIKDRLTQLEQRNSELEASIEYYENYIAGLETSTEAVITVVIDGKVDRIVKVEKGTTLNVAAPENTTYLIFNYWTVDGAKVDETYVVSTNITLVANITKRYDVLYMLDDNNTHSSQVVQQGAYATVPTTPTRSGYNFLGWSLDRTSIIDTSTVQITKHTTFYAVWEKQEVLPFVIHNGELISYTGSQTNVVIPATYSLGDLVENEVIFSYDTGIVYAYFEDEKYDACADAFTKFFKHETLTEEVVSAMREQQILCFPGYQDGIYNYQVIEGENGHAIYQIMATYNKAVTGKKCSVTTISSSAFVGLSGLVTVQIPSTVQIIDNSAFEEMQELTNVIFADNSNLQVIGNKAFYHCVKLASFATPNSVTKISEHAFAYSALAVFNVPTSLEIVSAGAFLGTHIKSFVSNSISELGDSAFSGCGSLEELTLGQITTLEGFNIVSSKLTQVRIPSTVQLIASRAVQCDVTLIITNADVVFEDGAFEGNITIKTDTQAKADIITAKLNSIQATNVNVVVDETI